GSQKRDRFRTYAAGNHVVDPLPWHRRHGELLAVLFSIEPVVALGVIEEQRTLRAGDLDPGRAIIWIAWRQVPATANHHGHAIVHGDRGEHHVVGAVDGFHVAIGAL